MSVTRKGNSFLVPASEVTHVYVGAQFRVQNVSKSVDVVEVVVDNAHDWRVFAEHNGLYVKLDGVHNVITGHVTGTTIQVGNVSGNLDLRGDGPKIQTPTVTVKIPNGSGITVKKW